MDSVSKLFEESARTSIVTYFVLNKIVTKEEFSDRIDEFEVIKDGSVDYIRLNNLFDFYNEEFPEEKMRILINTHFLVLEQSLLRKGIQDM